MTNPEAAVIPPASPEQSKLKDVYERAVNLAEVAINAVAELCEISEEHPYIGGARIKRIADSIPSRYK